MSLFFPEDISKFSNEFLQNLPNLSNEEIAFQVMKDFAGDEIPEAELRKIVAETIAFEIPLKKVTENISVLELFHGPTLAFKDVGARFMILFIPWKFYSTFQLPRIHGGRCVFSN